MSVRILLLQSGMARATISFLFDVLFLEKQPVNCVEGRYLHRPTEAIYRSLSSSNTWPLDLGNLHLQHYVVGNLWVFTADVIS